MKKNKFVFFLLFIATMLFANNAKAQEYKYEVGGAAGTSFYLGDANKTKFYLHPGIAGGALFRYNVNFHWAAKANLLAGTISGNTADAGNVFPFGGQASFKRTFIDLGGQIEFNFFPYSDKFSYRDTKPYTPYITVGAGTTFGTGSESFFNVNIPVGIGFKYKIKERFNVGLEFSVRKLLGDDFDVTEKQPALNLDSPYGIKSSFLKNKDWYSLTMLSLTWDFGIRRDPCCD